MLTFDERLDFLYPQLSRKPKLPKWIIVGVIIGILLIGWVVWAWAGENAPIHHVVWINSKGESSVIIDYKAIRQIESSYNNRAISPCGAIGAYQIMPCVLYEYNNAHSGDWAGQNHPLTQIDLFYYDTNSAVAYWYLETRIPQMLRWYNKPITIDNILWAYNAGIGRVVEGVMPSETKQYIKKYKKLARQK